MTATAGKMRFDELLTANINGGECSRAINESSKEFSSIVINDIV